MEVFGLIFFIRIWFMFTNKKETERDFGGTKSQLKYRMWLTWQMKCIPLLFLVDFSFQTFVNGRLFIAFLVKHNEMLMGNWVSKGEVKDKRKMTKTTEKTWNSRENVLDSYRLLFERSFEGLWLRFESITKITLSFGLTINLISMTVILIKLRRSIYKFITNILWL